MTATAEPTYPARSVMVNEHAVSLRKTGCSFTEFDDLARRLVPKHQRGFALHIPAHDVAGTHAANMGSYQSFATPGPRRFGLFDADVIDRIKTRYFHEASPITGV